MIDPYKATETQFENVIGTLHLIWAIKAECPDCHLIKLGTMGEYGAPDCDIPEGKIPSNCLDDIYPEVKCPMSGLLFPRTPGSFYHASKVMDTINIEFACRNWGLRSTDIMQGVVFGLNETDNEELLTRFDYDSYFGTAINRFCAQAVSGHTLTVYGEGNQTRGFLPLKDSLQCLTLAIENPPSPGEYRTLNQYEDLYSINDLANRVKELSSSLGLTPSISHISNPRNEAENHYYNPTNKNLFTLGYKPTHSINPEISTLLSTCFQYKSRIKKEVIMPKTTWR
jgi:UDP-sulfoquinovose synthase